MPKRRPATSNPAAEDYESDNGFIVEDDAPKGKKARTTATKDTKNVKSERSGKSVRDGGGTVGESGEVFWELSGKRRVGVQEFKGNTMVNVREYYEKDGAMLPGKKGISLPIDQFNTLISVLPQLEKVLTEKGEKIERPDYGGAGAAAAVADDEEDEPEAKGKKNFEETSDEE